MLSQDRMRELRDRFDIQSGGMRTPYRYKNLNWYMNDQWFCFSDIGEEDIDRIVAELKEGEVLTLGWKDMQPHQKMHEMFGDGGGLWLILAHDGVLYDVREKVGNGNAG